MYIHHSPRKIDNGFGAHSVLPIEAHSDICMYGLGSLPWEREVTFNREKKSQFSKNRTKFFKMLSKVYRI